MEQWHQLVEVVGSVVLTDDIDALIWQLDNKGVYSTSSLYHIINFRGVQPIYIPAVWSIKVPPRVQVFLWLLSHNKLMTKDNLAKRGIEKPPDCVYCTDKETMDQLYFGCVVAKQIWRRVSILLSIDLGSDYLSISRFWPANKKHTVLNSICACIIWTSWKNRNAHVFNNVVWIDLKQI